MNRKTKDAVEKNVQNKQKTEFAVRRSKNKKVLSEGKKGRVSNVDGCGWGWYNKPVRKPDGS